MSINIYIYLKYILFYNIYPTLYTTPPSLTTFPTTLSTITMLLGAHYFVGTPCFKDHNTNYFFTTYPLPTSNRNFPASVTIILPQFRTTKNLRYFKQTSTHFLSTMLLPCIILLYQLHKIKTPMYVL